MRKMVLGLAAALVLWAVSPAAAVVLITENRGGNVAAYKNEFERIKRSGKMVAIAGRCQSACTLVLVVIPRERICIDPYHARLEFHETSFRYDDGSVVRDEEGTRWLFQSYPAHVKKWIARKGGLKTELVELYGKELAAMYPACGDDIKVTYTLPQLPSAINPAALRQPLQMTVRPYAPESYVRTGRGTIIIGPSK